MGRHTVDGKYQDRLKTLRRRRDFLESRVADYQGKDSSRDKAEASALHWAIGVVELNYESATDLIRQEKGIDQATTNLTREGGDGASEVTP